MMRFKLFLLIIILTWGVIFNSSGQQSADSTLVRKTVTDFYGWYLSAVKNHKNAEFEPVFTKNSNGKMTLDFSEYFAQLKKYKFSDNLMHAEKSSYNICLDSLAKINDSDFNTRYTDLSDYERINCDFSNYYRWVGGQEPVDAIKISSIKIKTSSFALVEIRNAFYNAEEKVYHLYGTIEVSLIKHQGVWEIDTIKNILK
ncbi:MAG: hypothetical protein JWM14_870 [Chitinophagaceae bacterium]|nr:hypothetical protein [Chitinophagaceae bacterium]